jgi:hypothetical protein
MAFLQRGGAIVVTVPAGQSIAVGALRGSQAQVLIPSGLSGGPISLVNNSTQTFGPYISGAAISVSCISGAAEYVVDVTPALTDGPSNAASATNLGLVKGTGVASDGSLITSQKFNGGRRLRGNSGFVTGASGLSTTSYKIEAEGPFVAVRVCYGEKYASGTPPTIEALVAATDTGLIDTATNCFQPVVAGVAYNAIKTTANGWTRVTWDNGATSKVSALAPIANNSAAYMVSDWIPCKSLPRTDVVGGRPMALLKLANTNVAAGFAQGNGNFSATYNTLRGQLAYREIISNNTANDGVNTLTNVPTLSTSLGNEKYAWLEFQYDTAVRNVIVIGDSRFEAASSTYNTSWALIGLTELSTQTAPINIENFAGSGHSHTQYLLLLDYILAAGGLYTDVIFQGSSQNGFGPNHLGAEQLLARDMIYLQKLKALGINVWMTTDYGVNGYAGAQEAARLECVAQIKRFGANGLATVIDTDALITDYSGGNGIITAAYNSGDNVHANYAGQRIMADALKSAWK